MADFVLTLPLKTEKWQEDLLEKRLNIARQIYNACLGEILSRYWFMQMVQEIAERAFHAFEKLMFGTAKKVTFKVFGEFFSVREKGNVTGFRYFEDRNVIEWIGLTMPIVIKRRDEYAGKCFEKKLKFCKLLKKVIRGKNRYFVQMTFEGEPPQKQNREISKDENARVGLDIGTSTVAISSENDVKLFELAETINEDEKRKRILQRKLDRQRRANNPNKYKEDGTIKKGNRERWVKSKGYMKTQRELAELQRMIADKRKQSHNRLANYILSLGLDIRVETMNFKGLQKRAKETTINWKIGKINRKKRFGKSLAYKAPSMLIQLIDNKLKYLGLSIKKIDTYQVKASQFEHFTESYVKKPLSQRWNSFETGKIQRDLYSAFLIMNTKSNLEEIDVARANVTFANFLELHNKEIDRIRAIGKKQPSSIGI